MNESTFTEWKHISFFFTQNYSGFTLNWSDCETICVFMDYVVKWNISDKVFSEELTGPKLLTNINKNRN